MKRQMESIHNIPKYWIMCTRTCLIIQCSSGVLQLPSGAVSFDDFLGQVPVTNMGIPPKTKAATGEAI
nr:unnamed protein product [Callosobruchus analis]